LAPLFSGPLCSLGANEEGKIAELWGLRSSMREKEKVLAEMHFVKGWEN